MKTSADLTFEKVRFDIENEAHLVINLTAPKIEWQKKRPPICLIPVIDVSGSMAGLKIEYAKQSVLKLIDHLQPGDYCGLVTFSTDVEEVFKPMEMTASTKEKVKVKVGELRDIASTNFSGGMTTALEAINKMDLPPEVVRRIIMFTDGHANHGVATSHTDILKLAQKSRGKASISAFGYGEGANQEMLADLAKTCDGNYAFVKNPEDALSAFAKELGGLLSVYAQGIKVMVAPHGEHKIEKVVSDVDSTEDNGKITIKLTDILSEESRNLVLGVKLAKQSQALPRLMSVFDVTVEYDTIGEDGKKSSKTEELKAKVQFVKEGEQQDKPTLALDEVVGLAQVVQAQIESEKLAANGDYKGAVCVMQKTSGELQARGLKSFHLCDHISDSMKDAGAYQSSGGYRSSVLRGNDRAYTVSSMDKQAAADLNFVGVSISNSTMDAMNKSFQAPEDPVAPEPPQAPEPPKVEPPKKPTLSKSKSSRW